MIAPSTTAGDTTARKQALSQQPPLMPHSDLGAWTSTLIFAPHPDDESLGCGGLISLLRQRDQEVRIVFVSDGAMSHPNSRRYDRAARVRLREEEALEACSILGVSADNVTFLRHPDTEVPRRHHPGFEAAVRQIAQLIADARASHLLVPWRRDPHCDHRATWETCRTAVEETTNPPKWIEYPIWMWNSDKETDLPREDEVTAWRLDVSRVQSLKDSAVAAHVSQLTDLIDDDPEGFRLKSDMLANFRLGTELYFEDIDKKLHSLTGGYFERVYADSNDPWRFETSDYERQKYAHSIAVLGERRYGNAFEIGCSIGVLTALLAERCDRLLSVDVSEKPLVTARRRLAETTGVRFARMTVPEEFPDEKFDLIVMSEVGYYLSLEDLARTAECAKRSLRPGGELLLVHFTPYVPDYPLTGDEVHEYFAQVLDQGFTRLRSDRKPRYRLELYRKAGDVPNA